LEGKGGGGRDQFPYPQERKSGYVGKRLARGLPTPKRRKEIAKTGASVWHRTGPRRVEVPCPVRRQPTCRAVPTTRTRSCLLVIHNHTTRRVIARASFRPRCAATRHRRVTLGTSLAIDGVSERRYYSRDTLGDAGVCTTYACLRRVDQTRHSRVQRESFRVRITDACKTEHRAVA